MRELHWTSLWLFFKLYFFIIWTPCNSATSTTEPWIPHGRNIHSFAVVLFCCLIFTWFIFMKIIKQAFLKTLEWFCVVSRTSSPAIPHGFYTDPRHQHGRCLQVQEPLCFVPANERIWNIYKNDKDIGDIVELQTHQYLTVCHSESNEHTSELCLRALCAQVCFCTCYWHTRLKG